MNSPENIFNHYKHRLEYDEVNKKQNKSVRFGTIQYLCRFPKIDPIEMAVSIMKDDIEILFDDSSISNSENERYEKMVLKKYKQKEKR